MALLFLDGFEGYASTIGNIMPPKFNATSTSMPGKWSNYDAAAFSYINTTNFATTQPNGYSASFACFYYLAGFASLNIPSTTNIFVGFNFNQLSFATVPVTTGFFYLAGVNTLGPTSGIRLLLNGNGSVSLQTANGGTTFLTTPASVINANTWYSIELNAVFGGGTSGSLELRINGTSYIATSINSTGGLAGGYTFLTFQNAASNATNTTASCYDDLYVCDNTGTTNNTFAGSSNVYTLFPASNGTVDALTPVGAATNWQAVNQTSTVSGAKYNQATTTSQEDLYYLNNISSTPTAINAVVVTSYAAKVANGPNYNNQCVVGGTTSNGQIVTSTQTVTKSQDIFATQPGGSAWDKTSVNNMQIGITT